MFVNTHTGQHFDRVLSQVLAVGLEQRYRRFDNSGCVSNTFHHLYVKVVLFISDVEDQLGITYVCTYVIHYSFGIGRSELSFLRHRYDVSILHWRAHPVIGGFILRQKLDTFGVCEFRSIYCVFPMRLVCIHMHNIQAYRNFPVKNIYIFHKNIHGICDHWAKIIPCRRNLGPQGNDDHPGVV